jgi:ABC-2 type transport system permease protein
MAYCGWFVRELITNLSNVGDFVMKSFSAYLYFIKMKLLTSFIYRFEFIASVAGSLIVMMASVFLWKTVYHAVTTVDGIGINQMITYAILSGLLRIIFNVSVERAMYERILQGDIAIDYIRPTNILMCYLAEDIGIAMGALITKILPMLLLISIFFYAPLPASWLSFLLFIFSLILSFGISWLIDALVGVMHIKLFDLGSIGFIKDAIILLISGSIVPTWFFPEKIRIILGFLPFQYIYQTPLGIYIGKYSPNEIIASLIIQGLWVCLLLFWLDFIWKRYSKHVLVQGG